jgi:hypothetical protein
MITSTFTILRISAEAYDEIKQRIKDVDDSIGEQAFSYTDEYVLNEGTADEVIRFTRSEVAMQRIDEEEAEVRDKKRDKAMCKVCGEKPCAPSFDHCGDDDCVPY